MRKDTHAIMMVSSNAMQDTWEYDATAVPWRTIWRLKWKFLQKYMHRGAFFQEAADNPCAQDKVHDVYKREYSGATGEDKMDKSLLPKLMQVRPEWAGLTVKAQAGQQNVVLGRACRCPLRTGPAGQSPLNQGHAGEEEEHVRLQAVSSCRTSARQVQAALTCKSIQSKVMHVRQMRRMHSAVCIAESHAALVWTVLPCM